MMRSRKIGASNQEWTCDICGKERKKDSWGVAEFFPDTGPNSIGGHPERFCFECWGNGIMWAMKRAKKEK